MSQIEWKDFACRSVVVMALAGAIALGSVDGNAQTAAPTKREAGTVAPTPAFDAASQPAANYFDKYDVKPSKPTKDSATSPKKLKIDQRLQSFDEFMAERERSKVSAGLQKASPEAQAGIYRCGTEYVAASEGIARGCKLLTGETGVASDGHESKGSIKPKIVADYNLVQEALSRGYSIDEIADKLGTNAGIDPAEARRRGYSSQDMLVRLGYAPPPKLGNLTGLDRPAVDSKTRTPCAGRDVGTIEEGYRFKGGDTSQRGNWEKVGTGESGDPWNRPWNRNWDCQVVNPIAGGKSIATTPAETTPTVGLFDDLIEPKSDFTVIKSPTPRGGADVVSQQADRPGRDVLGLIVFWLLLIFGLVGYFKMRAVEKKAALESAPLPTDRLIGIRGWLRFFVISFGVLGPVLGLSKVDLAFRDDEMVYAALMHSSKWATYKTAVWLTLAAFLAFSIYSALKMRFVWKPSSVNLAKIALASWPAASVLTGLLIPMMIFPGQSMLDTKFVGSFLALIVSTVVWITYLSKSKRVRATYYGSLTGTRQPNSEMSGSTVSKQTLSVDSTTPVRGANNVGSSRKVEQEDKPYGGLATPTPEIARNVGVNSPREESWSTALTEFDGEARRPGLWARAFAEAQGNEAAAKANYLRYRASELDEAHQLQVAERQRELAKEALLTAQGTCPNTRCKAVIPLSSKECPKCGAFFEAGSTWSVHPLET